MAVVCAVATIAFGIYPEPLFNVARDAGDAFSRCSESDTRTRALSRRRLIPGGELSARPLWGSCRIAPTAGQASTRVHRRARPHGGAVRRRRAGGGRTGHRRAVVGQAPARPLHRRGDVCSARTAADAGLAPCPMKSDTTGREVVGHARSASSSGTAWTLTVTPQSDGSVTVVRTASGERGVAGGVGRRSRSVPVRSRRASGGARSASQAARRLGVPGPGGGRPVPRARALNSVEIDGSRRPGSRSRAAGELAARRPRGRRARAPRIAASSSASPASGSAALGGRDDARRRVTLYGRSALDGPRSRSRSCRRSGRGREEWLVEYTFGRDGPRELAFRRADAERRRQPVAETVGAARPARSRRTARSRSRCSTPTWPWPPTCGARRAVLRGSPRHGTVERRCRTSTTTRAAPRLGRGGLKFGGGGYKRIKVHRSSSRRRARTRRPSERERFDCVAQASKVSATSQVQSSTR